jgi:hypothetical protein
MQLPKQKKDHLKVDIGKKMKEQIDVYQIMALEDKD